MAQRRFRNLVFKLHAWLGVHLFLFYGLIFLTGTILVFRDQIETLISPDRQLEETVAYSERPSFGTLFESANAYAPDALVQEFYRPSSNWIADAALVITPDYQRKLLAFSGDGSHVSGEVNTFEVLLIVRQLHDSLFTNHEFGVLFVTAFAFVLFTFLVTGMITYRRFWKGYFRAPPRNSGPRAWWGGVHRLFAVWSLPFLLIISVSGAWFFLEHFISIPLQSASPDGMIERSEALPAGFNGETLDKAVALAQDAAPGVMFNYVRVPAFPDQVIFLAGSDDTILSDPGTNQVTIDPTSLEILDVSRSGDRPGVERARDGLIQLHYGHFGGVFGRTLWVIFGTLSTLLCIAGSMIYAARTKEPDTPTGAVKRLWTASLFTRIGYPLFVLGLAAVAVLRLA